VTFEEADAAYPYDPRVSVLMLVGLEKLRAFEDAGMRRNLFELHQATAKVAARPEKPAGYVPWDQRPAPAALAENPDESDRRFP
jgi:hypothetical protein